MNSPLLQSELIYICKLHGYRYNELPYMIGVGYSIIQELVYHGTYSELPTHSKADGLGFKGHRLTQW